MISALFGQELIQPFTTFAVGSNFRVDKSTDYNTFAQWVDSLMEECAANFAEDNSPQSAVHNLVVFGELFGMVTPLFVEEMVEAREEETLGGALSLLVTS